MAEDVTTEGRFAGKRSHAAGCCKCAGADQRIVSPEGAFLALNGGKAAREVRPVETGCELQEASEKRGEPDDLRQRLQQPQSRIGLHAPDHFQDGLAIHQAVGIKHQHVVVGTA